MLNEIQSTSGMKNINIDDIKITTAWFNMYDTQEFQELHDHNGYPVGDFHPCFSLVYILNSPNSSNDTVYRLKQMQFILQPSSGVRTNVAKSQVCKTCIPHKLYKLNRVSKVCRPNQLSLPA